MSMTDSLGIVGPSYWCYMASKLADCLERVVEEGRIEEDPIPKGVYADVVDFFELVLQAVTTSVPNNPPASLKAYAIATEALRSASRVHPPTRDAMRNSLVVFSSFAKDLMQPRNLRPDELEVARAMRSFFHQLYLAGESEDYENAVKPRDRLNV